MCIAIFQPAGAHISTYKLEICYDNNPDGAGYMFCRNGKVEIRKPFFRFEDFLAAYRQDEADNPESPFGLHFRIATHGHIDKRNAHPHRLSKSAAIIHNGIFNLKVPPKSPLSDTALFAAGVLKQLPKRWERSAGIVWLLEYFAGSSNKVVLLRGDGSHFILNRDGGNDEQGVWYSNLSHRYYNNVGTYGLGHGWAMGGGGRGGNVWDDDDSDLTYATRKADKAARKAARRAAAEGPHAIANRPRCKECDQPLKGDDAARYGDICGECFDVACYVADYEARHGRGSAGPEAISQAAVDRATAYLCDRRGDANAADASSGPVLPTDNGGDMKAN